MASNNPFSVDVINPLQALLLGQQSYQSGIEANKKRAKEQALAEASQMVASGDRQGGLAKLLGLGEYQGVNAISSLDNNAWTRQHTEARDKTADQHWGADYALRQRAANRADDKTPEGFTRGADGSLVPMPGGPRDPAYIGKIEAAKNPALASEPLKNEQSLRKEFEGSTKPHMEVRRGYERLLASKDDAVGDISLIFGYMKMLDPGSVVREGEFATAQNAAGVPDQIRNVYNRAMSGERLNPTQRNMFKGQAKNLYDASEREYSARERQMRTLAGKYRLNPDNIIPAIGPGPSAIAPEVPALPPGFELVK